VLATETQMFDKFYKHVESKIEYSVLGSGRLTSGSLANVSSQIDVAGSRLGGHKRSKSRTSNIDRTMCLTAEQKCEIAQRELEEYAEEVRMANEDSEKHVDELKVSEKLLSILLVMFASYSSGFDAIIWVSLTFPLNIWPNSVHQCAEFCEKFVKKSSADHMASCS